MSRFHLAAILRLPGQVLGVLACAAIAQAAPVGVNGEVRHVMTNDFSVVDAAFLHGYIHNQVADTIDSVTYHTLSIQCVSNKQHAPITPDQGKAFYSAWTRDLYWGFLGWAQAGDGPVLERMKSSIDLLRCAMKHNKAEGQNKRWPLNDGRYYIPQAICRGGVIAKDFYPYDSESQADFLLLIHQYWRQTDDRAYLQEIWPDVLYVTETIERMDSDGNALPDQLWGSYDYQDVGLNKEEPLMSAKAAAAYRGVAEMGRALGQNDLAVRLDGLALKIQQAMNKPTTAGGLWLNEPGGGGYYVNSRSIKKERIDQRFIPYENLVPMFFGMPSPAQTKAIFDQLDSRYEQLYPLKWGPMYTAPVPRKNQTVLECSSTPWLGFLDVYLRCRLGRPANRARIFQLLLDHAYDIPAAPFSEGAGVWGTLTGGAGRAWDNGNFFHCLVTGIYGIEKSAKGIAVSAPVNLPDRPLTQLRNVCWRDAVYEFKWVGAGSNIERLLLDGKSMPPARGRHGAALLTAATGTHQVTVMLSR